MEPWDRGTRKPEHVESTWLLDLVEADGRVTRHEAYTRDSVKFVIYDFTRDYTLGAFLGRHVGFAVTSRECLICTARTTLESHVRLLCAHKLVSRLGLSQCGWILWVTWSRQECSVEQSLSQRPKLAPNVRCFRRSSLRPEYR